jgi:hypothetical protein
VGSNPTPSASGRAKSGDRGARDRDPAEAFDPQLDPHGRGRRGLSRADIDAYFMEIPAWMQMDISREIRLAVLSSDPSTAIKLAALGLSGGGNLLAALGLVSYTEALGLIRLWNRKKGAYSKTEACFLAFFDEMHGGLYMTWRLDWESRHPETTLYEALRCGLVHEYAPKVDSAFWIAPGDPLGLDEDMGTLIFKVEPYFRHFGKEIERLYTELLSYADPEIPPPFLKKPPPPATPPRTGGASISPTS